MAFFTNFVTSKTKLLIMFNVKRLFSALILTIAAFAASTVASAHEKTFGINGGFVSYNSSGYAGLHFTYAFSNKVRIAPEVDMVFRGKSQDALMFDANVDFTFRTSSKFTIYPLVGLNYSAWKRHVRLTGGNDDLLHNSNKNHLGANVGAGFDVDITDHLRFGAKGMYTLIKDTDTARAGISLSYIF